MDTLCHNPSPNSISLIYSHNIQEEGIISTILSYNFSKTKALIYHLLNNLLIGIPYLLIRWSINCQIKFQLVPDSSQKPDVLLIESGDSKKTLTKVDWKIIGGKQLGIVNYRLYKYYFDG